MVKKVLFILLIGFSVIYSQTDDSYNRFRLGQSFEQTGDYQKARGIYESLYNADPLNYQFFEALNRVYIQLKNYDAAIAMVEKRISINPDDINMYGILGSIYHQKGDEKKAYDIWDEGLKRNTQSSINYRVIANYAIERRAFEKAVDILQKGKSLSKDVYSFSFEIANIYSVLMKFKEAAEEYSSILLNDPNQLAMIEGRVSTYINKPEAYNSTLEVFEKYADKSGQSSFLLLLAWLYMENNEYAKAYNIYLKMDEKQPNSGVDFLNFAQRALSNGYYDEAAKAYKKIMEKFPSTPYAATAEIGYAKTMETILNKKSDSLINDWKPFPEKLTGNREEYNDVIKAYKGIINNYKNNAASAEAYFHIAQIQMTRLNDLQGAEETFNQLLTLIPVSTLTEQTYRSLGEISILKNNLDKADGYFTKALNYVGADKTDKNYSEFMLAKIDFWKGNFPEASRELNIVTNNLSDNIANDAIELSLLINTTKNDSLSLLEFAKADLLTRQLQYKEALVKYQDLSKKDNLLTLKDLSSLRYAQMVTMLNDLPNAIALLQDLSNPDKGSIYADRALLLLGKIYQFGIKDLAQAKKSYEKLLANFPNSLYLDDARENITEMKIN